MNKPAPKEPSMDEILSSIRQIIADDDAAGAPRRPSAKPAAAPMQAAPVRQMAAASPAAVAADRDLSDMLDDIEPLALSSSQILSNLDDDDPMAGLSFDSILASASAVADKPTAFAPPELIEAEDITFDIAEPAFEPISAFDPEPAPSFESEPAFEAEQPFQAARSFAETAQMPDPSLSSEIADQLIEPATKAAVRNSITRLQGMDLGNAGATIESLVRDMLRPMLKEWLDENLPSVVERMVEKEITRVSRGGFD